MDALELTRELLRFNTINPPGEERACAQRLGELLEQAGFAVGSYEHAPGRTSLVARLVGSSARAALCFAGHIDTVPLGGTPWKWDPLAGEIADGRLYGRGSSDMKSGVAAFVTVACHLADRLDGTPGLVLVIVAGEETGRGTSRVRPALSDRRARLLSPSRPETIRTWVTRARSGSRARPPVLRRTGPCRSVASTPFTRRPAR